MMKDMPQYAGRALRAVLFALGVGLVFYKCRFGYAHMDETYYLTIPYRLTMGDALIVDEWHVAQLSAFLIYPFMAVYRLLFDSTDGIVLVFRYLYTALQTASALFVWWRLRRLGTWALGGALLYLMFAPYGIMALSYNSMGVSCVLLAAVLLATGSAHPRTDRFFAGLFLAGGVLCCPYLVLAYLALAAGFGVVWLRRRDRQALAALGWVTAGCAVLAAAFLAFVFSRSSLGELLANLPMVLSDEAHETVGPAGAVKRYLYVIWNSTDRAPLAMIGGTVLAAVILLDRRPGWRRWLYAAVAVLLTVWFIWPFAVSGANLNYMMFPVAYFGLFAFLFAPRRNRQLFRYVWCGGVLYGFCVCWSSNQGMFVVSMAATVSAVATCVMTANWLAEWREGAKDARPVRVLRVVLICLLAALLLLEARIRYNTLFWEYGGMAEMTYSITEGPEKGIQASLAAGSGYDSFYQDLAVVRRMKQGPVLYFTNNTFPYLCDEKPMGSFSAWLNGTDGTAMAKLDRYYRMNPEKFPRVAYCFQSDANAIQALNGLLLPLGYQVTATGMGLVYTAPAA